jgi:hypothetical protein
MSEDRMRTFSRSRCFDIGAVACAKARDVARDSDKKPVSCFMVFDLEVIGVGTDLPGVFGLT